MHAIFFRVKFVNYEVSSQKFNCNANKLWLHSCCRSNWANCLSSSAFWVFKIKLWRFLVVSISSPSFSKNCRSFGVVFLIWKFFFRSWQFFYSNLVIFLPSFGDFFLWGCKYLRIFPFLLFSWKRLDPRRYKTEIKINLKLLEIASQWGS